MTDLQRLSIETGKFTLIYTAQGAPGSQPIENIWGILKRYDKDGTAAQMKDLILNAYSVCALLPEPLDPTADAADAGAAAPAAPAAASLAPVASAAAAATATSAAAGASAAAAPAAAASSVAGVAAGGWQLVFCGCRLCRSLASAEAQPGVVQNDRARAAVHQQ